MLKRILFLLTGLAALKSQGQYRISGQIDSVFGKTVYLSYVEDYRKLSRIYMDQIIRRTETDSLGGFSFEGSNLPRENRIYRLHVDGCETGPLPSPHVLGVCDFSQSVLFIANNSDSLHFGKSAHGQPFCEILSTNVASDHFLILTALKEEMIVDFNDFNSGANKKINSEKWFVELQQFGAGLKEPLAELYAYDFLSDRRNETYAYYLKDLITNPYYGNLLERLKAAYPGSSYTQLYETEIAMDRELASGRRSSRFGWQWILALALLLSLGLNGYLLVRKNRYRKQVKTGILNKLTSQEQKIVDEILKEKTNKEIASALFISVSTVKTHINNLYKKLNVSNRAGIKGLFEKHY